MQKNIIFYLKMYLIKFNLILLYGFALQYVDSGTWWHGKIIVSNLLLVFRNELIHLRLMLDVLSHVGKIDEV